MPAIGACLDDYGLCGDLVGLDGAVLGLVGVFALKGALRGTAGLLFGVSSAPSAPACLVRMF